jgi:hypothetical protein
LTTEEEDDDVELVARSAPLIADLAERQIRLAVTLASLADRKKLRPPELEFLCGYIFGVCDCFAQGLGGRAGGSLSLTVLARVVESIYEERAERLLDILLTLAANHTPDFFDGAVAGGRDAQEVHNHVANKVESMLKPPFGLMARIGPDILKQSLDGDRTSSSDSIFKRLIRRFVR